jgi:hypothetical protein
MVKPDGVMASGEGRPDAAKPAADHRRGRPRGSRNAVDVVIVKPPACRACGSTRRSPYWGYRHVRVPGGGCTVDGRPYAELLYRRCRCLACGRLRVEKEYISP